MIYTEETPKTFGICKIVVSKYRMFFFFVLSPEKGWPEFLASYTLRMDINSSLTLEEFLSLMLIKI